MKIKKILKKIVPLLLIGFFGVFLLISRVNKIIHQRKIDFLLGFYQMKKEVTVNHLYLLEKIKEKKNDFLLIDVREKKDYQKCHFKGAINFLDNERDFLTKVKKLGKNKKEIIVYGLYQQDKRVLDTVVKLLQSKVMAKGLAIGWLEWKYIFGRELFNKGEDINRYLEPDGCLINDYQLFLPMMPAGSVPAPDEVPPVRPGFVQ